MAAKNFAVAASAKTQGQDVIRLENFPDKSVQAIQVVIKLELQKVNQEYVFSYGQLDETQVLFSHVHRRRYPLCVKTNWQQVVGIFVFQKVVVKAVLKLLRVVNHNYVLNRNGQFYLVAPHRLFLVVSPHCKLSVARLK